MPASRSHFHFDELLRAVMRDIFGEFDEARLAELIPRLSTVELAAGQVLVCEGEQSDAMYIVLSGRLRACTGVGERTVTLGEISRGEVIGEMGVITGKPRSATVQAVRDCVLMRVGAADVEAVLHTWPNVALPLMRKLLERQARINQRATEQRRVVNVCVLPITALRGGSSSELVAAELRAQLEDCLQRTEGTGQVALHTYAKLPQAFRDKDWEQSGSRKRRIAIWLDEQEQQHRMQVFAADAGDTPWTRLCIRHADTILLLADADAKPHLTPLEERYLMGEAPLSRAAQTLLLVHPDDRRMPAGTRRWLAPRPHLGANGISHLHLRPVHAGDWARLGRILSGHAIGLVFAGGGAKGFSQLGVMQALAEQGIVWDMAGGTSIGAVMASYAAMDLPHESIVRHARRAFMRNPTRDYNVLPLISMLRGRRLRAVIGDAVADAAGLNLHAEDLWLPFFCVASNYSQARTEVLRTGPLATMLTASVSIPAALPPVLWKGDLLTDGGTFNNYPVDVMRDCGAAQVIGVDLRNEVYRPLTITRVPGPLAMLVDRYFRRKSARVYGDVPSLPTAVMNVALLPSVAHDRKMREMVDLQFVPEVDNVGLLEWKRFDEVVQIGLKHGRHVLRQSGNEGMVRQLRRASLSAAVHAEELLDSDDAPATVSSNLSHV